MTDNQKIIFLHNTVAEYRIPLFKELKKHFNESIQIWIYHDKKKIIDFHFFKYKKIFVLFSTDVILNLLKTDFDILIISGSHSYETIFFWIIAKLKKKHVIFWTETWMWPNMNIKDIFFLKILSLIAKNSERVIYPGKKVKEFYDYLKIDDKKQFFAPNTSFKKNFKASINNNPFSLGFFSRIIPRKGLHLLLKSIKNLKGKYKLHYSGIIEDEKYNNFCMKISRNLKDVYFYKSINSEEKLSKFFSKFSIFIYPSTSYFGMAEPWGLALNEAIQANKFIISTTAVAAAYDLIEPGKNGFIINENNDKELSMAIKKSSKIDFKLKNKVNEDKLKIYSYKNMSEGFIRAIEGL